MITTLISKGFIIGLIITGGLGPIALLCIKRTLQNGFLSGLFTGLGAALADGIYGALGILGATLVSEHITKHYHFLQAFAALFFISFGIKTLSAKVRIQNNPAKRLPLLSDFSSGFALTIANPGTLIAVMALVASFELISAPLSQLNTVSFSTAILCGSLSWWVTLAVISFSLRAKINQKTITFFNKLCGLGLILFGIYMLISSLIIQK